ncbi:hypothetical protein GCM10011344_08520 [Dokdonia pacifica]|uniref:hypothetical protein n=1 Tax=Dokdonia pacifica TaxID=1627892 RepID=UPI000B78C64C|nr:hypothetical protein [Dokdonia pacifica]GGG10139.1 hypothetical protein GCM10011344_08520 [Dokdonia pacifica]
MEVEFKLYYTICTDPIKSNKYTYIISGQLYNYNKSINWPLEYIDCNGNKQIENKNIFIGGKNASLGRNENLDQRFAGFLESHSKDFYILKIEDLVKNNKFLEAKTTLEDNSSIIKDSTLITKMRSNIHNKALDFYLNSLKSSLDIQQASKLINEAERLFPSLPAELASKKREIALIIQEQKRIEIKNKLDVLISQNNILEALIVYNANINVYLSQNTESTLIIKAKLAVNNSFISKDFEYAKKVFNELYKLTGDKKLLTEIQKCDRELKKMELPKLLKLHAQLKNEVKLNKSISSLENLYYFEEKHDYFNTKASVKKLEEAWLKSIKMNVKKGKKECKNRDYENGLINLNNAIDKINDYTSKPYSLNNTELKKIKSELIYKQTKISKIVNNNSSAELARIKNNYEKKKLKHRVLKLGVTYNFVNEPIDGLNTYFDDSSNILNDLEDVYNNFDTSSISTFIIYNRFGVFAGNFNTFTNIESYDAGLYFRFLGNLYGKVGYCIKNNKPLMINDFTSNYVTGISFIANGINIETTYNHYFKSVQFGLGFNLFKRINKQRYKYLKSVTR